MQPPAELQLIRQCLDGDAEAVAQLRESHQPLLLSVLRRRGAQAHEAEDVLAELWGDCVPGREDRGSLLEKHDGQGPLKSWLATVATRRLVDRKRRERRMEPLAGRDTDWTKEEAHPATALHSPGEGALTTLLRGALEEAFHECDAEALMMMRLVFLHGLTRRELARMWGCHEAKVSRALSAAQRGIRQRTLRRIHRHDPWLELNWQDVAEMCGATLTERLPK